MGRRSDFPRIDKDSYDTPVSAVLPLLPFLSPKTRFIEPCGGKGALTAALEAQGHQCIYQCDIAPRTAGIVERDALSLSERDVANAGVIITNPPWTRHLLHPLIDHFRRLKPTWFLLDAPWFHTGQAAPFLPFCSRIISVGRVRWIENSAHTSKDDACWARFEAFESQTTFVGKPIKTGVAIRLETVASPTLSAELMPEYIEMFGLAESGGTR